MEEEKTSKLKPHTSFIRRLSIAKKLRGTWQKPNKNVKNFIYRGNMTKGEHDKGGTWQRGNMAKGEYGKGYYGTSLREI